MIAITFLFAWWVPRFEPVFQDLEIDVPWLAQHGLSTALSVRSFGLPLFALAAILIVIMVTTIRKRCPHSVALGVWVGASVVLWVPWNLAHGDRVDGLIVAAVVLAITTVCRPWKSSQRALVAANTALILSVGVQAMAVQHTVSTIQRVLESA